MTPLERVELRRIEAADAWDRAARAAQEAADAQNLWAETLQEVLLAGAGVGSSPGEDEPVGGAAVSPAPPTSSDDEWPPEVGSVWRDREGDEFTVLQLEGGYVVAHYGRLGVHKLHRRGGLTPWTKVRGPQS